MVRALYILFLFFIPDSMVNPTEAYLNTSYITRENTWVGVW